MSVKRGKGIGQFCSYCRVGYFHNNKNRAYPNPCSGQRTFALICWFEQAVILCGGTKAQKEQSHHSNSGCWTGILVTLIGCLCGADPYSFMKEHVISIEEISCEAGAMHQPLTMPNQWNCVCEVVDKQWLQISCKCEGHSTVFPGTCAHFGMIWHIGLKNLTASPWASSIQ